jgi:hypothetical protein
VGVGFKTDTSVFVRWLGWSAYFMNTPAERILPDFIGMCHNHLWQIQVIVLVIARDEAICLGVRSILERCCLNQKDCFAPLAMTNTF